jgi:hypothetical protein
MRKRPGTVASATAPAAGSRTSGASKPPTGSASFCSTSAGNQAACSCGMKLSEFLSTLLAAGKVEVEVAPQMEVDPEAAVLLQQYEAQWRLRQPGSPPVFHPAPALWAAELLYHTCRLVVCRQAENSEIRLAFDRPCPEPPAAAVAYSVDVVFHHLPAVFTLAKRLAPDDLLVTELKRTAAAWPLSSVGIEGLATGELEHILDHPALARMYLDRIFQTHDTARANDPRVMAAIREALGAYPALSPQLAKILNQETEPAA